MQLETKLVTSVSLLAAHDSQSQGQNFHRLGCWASVASPSFQRVQAGGHTGQVTSFSSDT